jgi:uncharacterized protein YhbP (UPF0306 family)
VALKALDFRWEDKIDDRPAVCPWAKCMKDLIQLANAENEWVGCITPTPLELLQKAQQLLSDIIFCAVSTCSPDGIPWMSPVFFAFDKQINLYWSSAVTARHTQNIYNNTGKAAIAVYPSDRGEGCSEGVYLSGVVAELVSEEVPAAMLLLGKRAGSPIERIPSDYLGESPRRIFRFQPEEAWITGQRLQVGNQLVDTKMVIDLSALRNLYQDDNEQLKQDN